MGDIIDEAALLNRTEHMSWKFKWSSNWVN
jgi:hypothetical protein